MKLIQSCEQRYYHYKVLNTDKDSDYTESEALGLGKAYHHVLEKTLHKYWDEKLLIEAMAEHKVDQDDANLLRVMLTKYVEFRKKSGLEIVRCEFGIETSEYVGFADAFAIDKSNNTWWIVDLKTAGRHDPNLIPQIAKDMQVGLYSHFVADIENAVDALKGYTFGGFRYNQCIKSKASTAKGLDSGVKVYEIVIPAELIAEGEAWSMFQEVHNRALELHAGEAPRKNLSSCFSYFSPCPYFSKCHGNLFSEGNKKVIVNTIESLEDKELL